MSRLPEVIATVRRRRRRTTEEKVAILDVAFRRGGSVAAAADRSEVSRALLYLWCSQVRSGAMPGVTLNEGESAAFAPVTLVAEVPPSNSSRRTGAQGAPTCRHDRGAAAQWTHRQGR